MTTDTLDRRTTVLTPPLRTRFASWRFWIVTAVLLALVAILWTAATASSSDTTAFGYDNAGPNGGRAVAEVLRQQGVDVTLAGTFAEVQAAVSDPATTAVVLNDPFDLLDLEEASGLDTIAADLVIMSPTTPVLDRFAPGVALAGAAEEGEVLSAGCAVPVAERAGSITAGESGLQPLDDSAEAVFCFTDEAGSSQLALVTGGAADVAVVASSSAFSNEHVATGPGNAAVILGLLGAQPTLVWYEPGLSASAGGDATIAELTPGWVSPVLILLIVVFIAAAVWRGRRMGPLVLENLPAVVRAGETIEGRARLYRRSSARLHSLDSLRIGTVGRIASALRLPRTAGVDEVSRAASAATGRGLDEVSALLVDDIPGSDRALIESARRLTELEREVRAAIGLGPSEPAERP